MYMAYGWPQVIPLEQNSFPTSQRIVYLRVVNRMLLVVSPSHLELWSSSKHKVRQGKYRRDEDSFQREGENLQAVWSPGTKLIAVLFYGASELDRFSNGLKDVNSLSHALSNGIPSGEVHGGMVSSKKVSMKSAIVQLELCFPMRLLVVLYSDGQLISCSVSKKGLRQVDLIRVENRLGNGDAVCTSIAPA